MADYTARLAPLKKGGHWRVQINWPSGAIRLFGKFDSQLKALEWINAHQGLTQYATVPKDSIPKKRTKRRFRAPTKNSHWGFSTKGLEKLGNRPSVPELIAYGNWTEICIGTARLFTREHRRQH